MTIPIGVGSTWRATIGAGHARRCIAGPEFGARNKMLSGKMLNGLWTLEITDSRGLRAHGLVLLRNGAVLGNGDAIDIAGSYEEREDSILTTLHVVLRGRGPGGEPIAERVHLQAQGQAIGDVIAASAIFLEDGGRCADIRLELRATTDQPRFGLSAGAPPMAERPLGPGAADPSASNDVRSRPRRARMFLP